MSDNQYEIIKKNTHTKANNLLVTKVLVINSLLLMNIN